MINFFSLETMSSPTPFASLLAQLDHAAPAVGHSVIPESNGGAGGVGNVNLVDHRAALGMLMAKSTKLFFPVLLQQKKKVCLSFVGMGATFCLQTSCSIASHQDATQRYKFQWDEIIVIKKNDIMAFGDPSAPLTWMDPELLNHWMANPKSLVEWREAFLAFKWCLKALPLKIGDLVTTDMMSAKKKFQIQAQEARMPAHTLFPDSVEAKDEGFIEVTGLATPSLLNPAGILAPVLEYRKFRPKLPACRIGFCYEHSSHA
jgi:hypothetical protein